jgi:Protein of unknown function (DUF3592)
MPTESIINRRGALIAALGVSLLLTVTTGALSLHLSMAIAGLSARGVSTTAMITKVEHEYITNGTPARPITYVTVSFTDDSGDIVRARYTLLDHVEYQEGHAVQILYDPQQPTSIRPAAARTDPRIITAVGGGFSALLGLGMAIYLALRLTRRTASTSR